ncbi:HAD family hydrolase [Candidatus Daviesbacteria bacterium]|nr:HAD family hydrolase [Candidatus Daviesbacteria bacterium]
MVKSRKVEKKALFLDRDGVINKKPPEHDYVKSWDEFELLPDVISAVLLARDKGYFVIVISNQRGISRKLMRTEVVDGIHKNLNEILKRNGTYIDAFYLCPHDIPDNCECRKPKPGLIMKAALDFDIDLGKSFYIGDSQTDYQAGVAAGVRTALIETNGSLLHAVKGILN